MVINKNSVLLVVDTLHIGGAEQQVVRDANMLHGNGWDITIACFESGELAVQLDDDIKFFVIKGNGFFQQLISLSKLCVGISPSIIHANLTKSNFISSLVGKKHKIPVVITEHGLGLWRLNKPRYKIIVGLTYYFCTKIICVCHAAKHVKIEYEKAPDQKIMVIYNSCPPKGITKNPERKKTLYKYRIPDRKIVGFVGRFTQIKRFDLFIDVIEKIKAIDPETLFILIGDGPERQSVQEMANNKGINASIHFMGLQTKDTIADLYQIMHTTILTSQVEAHSLFLLESAYYHLPSVAFNVGGNSEIIKDGETGYLIPFADTNQFAERLNNILINNELKEKMGKKAHERVTQLFSEEMRIEKLENLYMELKKI